jgi:hypothetical protein
VFRPSLAGPWPDIPTVPSHSFNWKQRTWGSMISLLGWAQTYGFGSYGTLTFPLKIT